MNHQPILYSVIGLLAGVVIAGFTASYAVNHNNSSIMGTFGMHYTSDVSKTAGGTAMGNDMMDHTAPAGDMSMNNMISELNGRTGDDFDKAFLTEMVAHHQGAIEMAKLVSAQAKHQELKDLANNIISAQSSEITKMQAWQKNWGY
jgi:uncharacterized protein (DUF305 family)